MERLTGETDVKRCQWAEGDPLLKAYHDTEWGRRVTGDRELFEQLILELFQTGLSWRTVLHKREAFRKAFDQFDLERIAAYKETTIDDLLQNVGIIRHQRKIEATVYNAQVGLHLIDEYGSLYAFFNQLPEDFTDKMKVVKQHFKHVGPSVLESFLFAAGFSKPPHDPECFLGRENTRGVGVF